MRAFYYLFILFNNLLSIGSYTSTRLVWAKIWGEGGLAPPPSPWWAPPM